MQLDNKENLIVNINNKTQLYSEEEVKKALQDYENNKIATNQISFCANHDRDTEEAIHKYYGHKENKTIYGDSFPSPKNKGLIPTKSFDTIFKEWQENLEKTQDPIVNAVRKDLLQRSQVGIKKYGVTLDRNDLSLKDWITHVYEELLDACNYLKKVSIELNKKESNTLLETHTMD